MTLEYMLENDTDINLAGRALLESHLADRNSREVRIALIDDSQGSSPLGSGVGYFIGLTHGLARSLGPIYASRWAEPIANDLDLLLGTSKAGGYSTSTELDTTERSYMPPGIGNSQSLANPYYYHTGAGANSGSGDGFTFCLHAPLNLSTSSSNPIVVEAQANDYPYVDVSEGASLEILTAAAVGKTGNSMKVELKPWNGSGSPYFATERAEQNVDLSDEEGEFGSAFYKHRFEFPAMGTYDAADVGKNYNAVARCFGVGGDGTQPGAAIVAGRWTSNINKGISLSAFSTGGVRMNHLTETHANCGTAMRAMGDPDIILMGAFNNYYSLSWTLDDIISHAYDTLEMARKDFRRAVVLFVIDPVSHLGSAEGSTGGSESFDLIYTRIKELVLSSGVPAGVLNLRKRSHQMGAYPGSGTALAPVNSVATAWHQDGVHFTYEGGRNFGQIVVDLMLQAAALGPSQPRPRVFR